jgi:hypothetical protein
MSKDIVDLLDRYGYNPIHVIGNLYLVRMYSRHHVACSFYLPKIIKNLLTKSKRYDSI